MEKECILADGMKGQRVLIFDFLCLDMCFWIEGKRSLGEDGWAFCNTKGHEGWHKGTQR